MYKSKKVAVVVPCYNEQSQIGIVINTMPDFVDFIVIVNDKSKDDTSKIVKEYALSNSKIVLLEHEINQGVGGAIASGYKWARDNSIELTAVMAGDAQMDPKDLPSLLDPVADGSADYSKGNRLFTGEAFNKIPKIRYFGNSALSLFTKIASGYWNIADSQTGYTVINLRALRLINWDSMFKRYGQPNDLLVKLNIYNLRVIDVPIEPVYGVGEKSGIKVHKVIFTIGWLLIKLFFWRLKEKYIIRDFHPLVFFYAFGFFMLPLAALFLVRTLSIWISDGAVPEISFLVFMFTSATAMNSIMFAMWLDYQHNKDLGKSSIG